MLTRHTWRFSCGHEFSITEHPKKPTPQGIVDGNPKTSPDQCFQCKEEKHQSEEKENAERQRINDAIEAHKAHAKFLERQIESPAAGKDSQLRSSFFECYHDCVVKIKELLVQHHALNKEASLSGGTLQANLKIWHERVFFINEALVLEIKEVKEISGIASDEYRIADRLRSKWERICEEFEDLKEEIEGFERRLKNIMDGAVKLAKK